MDNQFTPFEERIRRVAERNPGMPVENVTLTRMFFYVYKALEDSANHFLAAYGLNNTHYIALIMIYSSEGNMLNPCKLSEALLSSRANITRLTDELVENGWVERQGSSADRRRVELSLTPAGTALIEKILPRNWERIDRLWAGFSPEEIALTGNLLRKLLSRIGQVDGDEHAC
ncbi:MarR family transcriptional regulator [Sulfurimicrobium lacus]|uniref:MarR family transcriptional regulator n=1 Tax=Sulfurimicrobium lacus TaxID=2715678 RepID=A0A6F8VBL7_9PROT|nr:MarR family transcriptional regulator [Sulfurimicrobium lacus]BCB26507.1 MarR family transcriptional regulator [Sulfurimicrobium lacus]